MNNSDKCVIVNRQCVCIITLQQSVAKIKQENKTQLAGVSRDRQYEKYENVERLEI